MRCKSLAYHFSKQRFQAREKVLQGIHHDHFSNNTVKRRQQITRGEQLIYDFQYLCNIRKMFSTSSLIRETKL